MGFVDWFNRSLERGQTAMREEPEPLEGTRMDLYNSIIPNFWNETYGNTYYGNADLVDRTWVAAVCQDLNASQIAAMKIEWHGPPGVDEPAWVSSPDPAQFPNGIGDALYAINDQIDGWGWSLQYVTDSYASGYPRRWTVIPSSACEPRFNNETGRREYKLGDSFLDPSRVIQIDRNPTTAAHGTSALRAFAQRAYSLLAAGNKSLAVSQDAAPAGYLRTEQRLTSDQADEVRDQWMSKRATANGAPAVLSQGTDFKATGINPQDMALLDTQKWDAMVIANAYGVPAPILNMALEGGLTYQNPEALMRMWWLTRLRTRSKRIMDSFGSQMLPAGQTVTQDASDITVEGSVEATDDPQLFTGGEGVTGTAARRVDSYRRWQNMSAVEEAVEVGVAHREFAAELTPGDGRTVDVRIVPYGERIQHNDGLGGVPTGEFYTEEVMPGAFNHQLNAAQRVVANYEHQQGVGGVVGRGLALREDRDGFHGTFTMLKTAHGDTALELVREGVLDGVSFEAKFKRSVRSAEGVVQRFKADLYAIAFTRFGAYKGAKVLAVRDEAETVIDEKFMPLAIDPKLVERCRRLGIELPQRYEAHPATDTPSDDGTSEDDTRQTDANDKSSEG